MESVEIPVSYRGFDFESLWRGREKTTAVELAIARDAFEEGSRARFLDAGVGFGRLFLPLRKIFHESVGLDSNPEGIERIAHEAGGEVPFWVRGNIYRMPFVDGAFSEATMLRVYHHLAHPVRALRELARVVVPGGILLVSANPAPSLGSLLTAIGETTTKGRPWPQGALHPGGLVQVASHPFPVYAAPRSHFERVLQEAGLRTVRTYGSGWEDFEPFRTLPVDFWRKWTLAVREMPWVPTVFAKCIVEGRPARVPPDAADILACPRCRAPLDGHELRSRTQGPVACPRCGPIGELRGNVLAFT